MEHLVQDRRQPGTETCWPIVLDVRWLGRAIAMQRSHMDSTGNRLLPSVLLALATVACCFEASAADAERAGGHVIPGLGEQVPAEAKNVSLSPQFKVYTFEQDGVKYVQINSLQDEVLTALIVTQGLQQQLPIGTKAGTPVVFVKQ